jgi:hypothetical protein
MEKIYCSRCIWFIIKYFKYYCNNKNNIRIEEIDTWKEHQSITSNIAEPQYINKNNDCPWYSKKEII